MSLLEGYRLFTGYYIYESEMASEAKLEFVKFLKEAKADDIIDILSGQYEGVDGLSEDEMKALHSFIEEKYGMGYAKKLAGKAAEKAGAMKHDVAMKARALKKSVPHKAKGKMRSGKEAAKAGAAKGAAGVKKGAGAAYRGTFKTAVGRTALAGAGGVAAGAGGMAAYKAKKK